MENKSNIIQFPGTRNAKLEEQKNRIKKTIYSMDVLCNSPHWNMITIHGEDLETLAEFGETITFPPATASKLISMLANQIAKQILVTEEFL